MGSRIRTRAFKTSKANTQHLVSATRQKADREQ